MKNFTAWTLSIIMIVMGLLIMIGGMFLPGLILAFIGLTFIPNFRAFVVEHTNIVAGSEARKLIYTTLWVTFIGSVIYWSMGETKKHEIAEAEAAKARQNMLEEQREARLVKLQKEQDERTAYFNENKESIIKDIQSLKDQKEYLKASEKVNLYIQAEDADLLALKNEISNIQRQIKIDKRTELILSELKTVPADNIDKNYKLYKELVSIHPENNKYQKKMEHYKNKVVERDARIAAEKIFYGEKPVRSAWDGSYREVERHLESAAHDPDSIDIENCTEPYKAKEGWIVLCKYRGKNAFGGMVLNHNWFVIRQNRVISVEDPDAYSVK